ncbi:MAG TPA: hypothetical protein VL175_00830 [Pirellulales bacterium]|nr:hypothetical protein [Pirellulales bacterium]
MPCVGLGGFDGEPAIADSHETGLPTSGREIRFARQCPAQQVAAPLAVAIQLGSQGRLHEAF